MPSVLGLNERNFRIRRVVGGIAAAFGGPSPSSAFVAVAVVAVGGGGGRVGIRRGVHDSSLSMAVAVAVRPPLPHRHGVLDRDSEFVLKGYIGTVICFVFCSCTVVIWNIMNTGFLLFFLFGIIIYIFITYFFH